MTENKSECNVNTSDLLLSFFFEEKNLMKLFTEFFVLFSLNCTVSLAKATERTNTFIHTCVRTWLNVLYIFMHSQYERTRICLQTIDISYDIYVVVFCRYSFAV